jgi:hypothetical protein
MAGSARLALALPQVKAIATRYLSRGLIHEHCGSSILVQQNKAHGLHCRTGQAMAQSLGDLAAASGSSAVCESGDAYGYHGGCIRTETEKSRRSHA